jgi:hypothetical protein
MTMWRADPMLSANTVAQNPGGSVIAASFTHAVVAFLAAAAELQATTNTCATMAVQREMKSGICALKGMSHAVG